VIIVWKYKASLAAVVLCLITSYHVVRIGEGLVRYMLRLNDRDLAQEARVSHAIDPPVLLLHRRFSATIQS
jgi:hypothetical protein